MTKHFYIFLTLLLATMLLSLPAASADSPNDILVVANKTVKVDAVSVAELKAIFLKKKVRWKTGLKAVPINAKDGTELKKEFLKRVFDMDQDLERSYWQDQKIRTGLVPPVTFRQLLKAVFNIRGSVSYVFRSQYREGVVKILLVLPAQ